MVDGFIDVAAGGYPLLSVDEAGNIHEQLDGQVPGCLYDSTVHHLEVAYLTPVSPRRHELTIGAASGEALAEHLGAEVSEPASGSRVQSYLGYGVSVVELRPDGPPVRTLVATEDTDVLVSAMTWADDAGAPLWWTGPWSRPRSDQRATLRLVSAGRSHEPDREIVVWGDYRDRAIASRSVGTPWPWKKPWRP